MSSRPDAAASLVLDSEVVRPAFLVWLDFVGDPVRSTTWIADITLAGTGDADLDGYTFDALDPDLVSISDAINREGGSETVTARLSGLVGPNTDLLNIIGDVSKWRGRDARLWCIVHDEQYMRQGAVWAYYTGRMVSARIGGSADDQFVEVGIESYLATLTQASNRTYLDQAYFDPGDLSAECAISIANGDTGGLSDQARTVGGLQGILATITANMVR